MAHSHKRFIALDGAIVGAMCASGLLGTSPVIRPSDIHKTIRFFKRISSLLCEKPQSFHISASVAAYELLLELQSSIRHAWPAPVELAVECMVHNMHKPVSNSELASSAGVSVSRLSLLFQETLGCSPVQYCTKRKMDAAGHLLTHCSKSIKEIAQMVGYDDQLHFSRSFHRHTGCSPRAFRIGARPADQPTSEH